MKWISVNEKTPNTTRMVLVYAPSCKIIGSILTAKCYESDKKRKSKEPPTWVVYDFHESDMNAIVTHWAELPKAPCEMIDDFENELVALPQPDVIKSVCSICKSDDNFLKVVCKNCGNKWDAMTMKKENLDNEIKPDVSGELPTTKQWAKIEQDFYDWKNECENRDNSDSWTPSNYELFNFIKNKFVGGNLR